MSVSLEFCRESALVIEKRFFIGNAPASFGGFAVEVAAQLSNFSNHRPQHRVMMKCKNVEIEFDEMVIDDVIAALVAIRDMNLYTKKDQRAGFIDYLAEPGEDK